MHDVVNTVNTVYSEGNTEGKAMEQLHQDQ